MPGRSNGAVASAGQSATLFTGSPWWDELTQLQVWGATFGGHLGLAEAVGK